MNVEVERATMVVDHLKAEELNEAMKTEKDEMNVEFNKKKHN